jgi:hypothetical protein
VGHIPARRTPGNVVQDHEETDQMNSARVLDADTAVFQVIDAVQLRVVEFRARG